MSTPFSFPFSSPFGSGFSFVPGGGSSLESLGPTPLSLLGGLGDQLIDPATLDYVRTENGEWAETADSRTIMMIQLDTEIGASPFDPQDGTAIKQMLRDGDLTEDVVLAETRRAAGILQAEGILSNLSVTIRDSDGNLLLDDKNRLQVRMSWQDLASGSPVSQTFIPR